MLLIVIQWRKSFRYCIWNRNRKLLVYREMECRYWGFCYITPLVQGSFGPFGIYDSPSRLGLSCWGFCCWSQNWIQSWHSSRSLELYDKILQLWTSNGVPFALPEPSLFVLFDRFISRTKWSLLVVTFAWKCTICFFELPKKCVYTRMELFRVGMSDKFTPNIWTRRGAGYIQNLHLIVFLAQFESIFE